ncbi:MAG: Gfo/Idh/MocA family oxidoreductase [Candidatus Eisenbacteria bacterium]
MERLPCGVVGVGHLGQHHVRIYRELPQAELVGIYDVDSERMKEIAGAHGTRAYQSLESLLDDVQAVSLVVPTSLHYEIGKIVLGAGRHVLIEKPITEEVEHGWELVEMARAKGVTLYAGHTERFSPPLRSALKWIRKPRFIEALRLAGFGVRGTDVSVVHDLMIHDIDLVLSTTESEIEKVEAIGVPVLTPNVDIANARLSFSDGTIASLTASRVSIERLRKLRLFQQDTYISIDFLKRDAKIYHRKMDVKDLPPGPTSNLDMQDLVEMVMPPVKDEEPLMLEISDFIASARGEKQPEVPGETGVRALEIATQIVRDIERRLAMWR